MTINPERLRRLARAQGELVKMLETTLLRAEHKSAALQAEQAQLDSMAATAGQTQPALLPALLRSLAATGQQMRLAETEVEKTRNSLLAAKSREKAMTGRAKRLEDVELRKSIEEEALDTALAMGAKASGKGGVVF